MPDPSQFNPANLNLQTPTTGTPSRVLGILGDIQMAPILSLKGFNADKPILGKQGGKPPGFFGKILADMGFTAQNLQEGASKANQAGHATVAQNSAQALAAAREAAMAGVTYSPVDTNSGPGGGSWANYVTNRGPRGGGMDIA